MKSNKVKFKETKFVEDGVDVHTVTIPDDMLLDNIPVCIYNMNFHQERGFWITKISERFQTPEKIYGNTYERADRVIKSFQSRTKSTGVLMSGHKGAGKTMLAHEICNRCLDAGVPVITVSSAFSGSGFAEYIDKLGVVCILFDEFGKVFKGSDDRSPQDGLLTLFDGNMSGKRLMLLTENAAADISDFMINRPGRILYHYKFAKIDFESVEEYCKDFSIEEDIIKKIQLRHSQSIKFSFDTIKSIVSDYILHKDIDETLSVLNIEQPMDWEEHVLKVSRVYNQDTGEEYLFPEQNIRDCRMTAATSRVTLFKAQEIPDINFKEQGIKEKNQIKKPELAKGKFELFPLEWDALMRYISQSWLVEETHLMGVTMSANNIVNDNGKTVVLYHPASKIVVEAKPATVNRNPAF
jgi:hypothetical protein